MKKNKNKKFKIFFEDPKKMIFKIDLQYGKNTCSAICS
jgi:hypothetical protein